MQCSFNAFMYSSIAARSVRSGGTGTRSTPGQPRAHSSPHSKGRTIRLLSREVRRDSQLWIQRRYRSRIFNNGIPRRYELRENRNEGNSCAAEREKRRAELYPGIEGTTL